MMKKTENFIINAPRWNAGIYKIGIALYRIKKANLNIICGYTRKRDGKKLWQGSLWVNERFCQKYPIIQYKLKTGKIKLYDVPLDDIKEFNNHIQEKIWANKNAKITSPIYSREQIAQILKDNPNIREIADFFGGGELLPE